jgi:hypothetical protein
MSETILFCSYTEYVNHILYISYSIKYFSLCISGFIIPLFIIKCSAAIGSIRVRHYYFIAFIKSLEKNPNKYILYGVINQPKNTIKTKVKIYQ